jgi:hypothetical protein
LKVFLTHSNDKRSQITNAKVGSKTLDGSYKTAVPRLLSTIVCDQAASDGYQACM